MLQNITLLDYEQLVSSITPSRRIPFKLVFCRGTLRAEPTLIKGPSEICVEKSPNLKKKKNNFNNN